MSNVTHAPTPPATAQTGNPARWWSRTESYGPSASARVLEIHFGPILWDGSRRAVEVKEGHGAGTLRKGRTDRFNPWRNPGPHAYINLQAADADECREAAAALILAAEIIEGAGR